MRPLEWALIQSDLGSLIRHQDTDTYRRTTKRRHQERTTTHQPKRTALGETSPVDTLILDFQPLEVQEHQFLLFKLPSL